MTGLSGCYSEYTQKVRSELASGVKYDSLFLGLKFGMTRNEFFEHCWELNKQKKLWHSSRNDAVLYRINNFKYEAKMEFYPNFEDEKIYEMPVRFQYVGWSPLVKELSSDSLRVEVMGLMEKWYGADFMKMEKETGEYAMVRVDGNRRIIITRDSDQSVKVLFTDLTVEIESEEEVEDDHEHDPNTQ